LKTARRRWLRLDFRRKRGIISPDDDSWKKLPFYAKHGVDELLIVDPQKRHVDWLGLEPRGEYRAIERSRLIELGPAELAERLDWPPPAS
jgi:Uma2 family endonuclease